MADRHEAAEPNSLKEVVDEVLAAAPGVGAGKHREEIPNHLGLDATIGELSILEKLEDGRLRYLDTLPGPGDKEKVMIVDRAELSRASGGYLYRFAEIKDMPPGLEPQEEADTQG